MIKATRKKENAMRLMGGNPPCQSSGFIHPSIPMKKRWTPAINIANKVTFRDVIKSIRSLSFLNSILKLILYIQRNIKAVIPPIRLRPANRVSVPLVSKNLGKMEGLIRRKLMIT